jgi:ethanolaminephosphotransferase
MFNLVPHVLLLIYFGPDLEGELPRWVYATLGLCYFLYIICDNCDGKQARRTGTTSALGMLLDHGLDSVTAVINNFILQRVMQMGNGPYNMWGLIVSTMPFYLAMLEQYYTGELVL